MVFDTEYQFTVRSRERTSHDWIDRILFYILWRGRSVSEKKGQQRKRNGRSNNKPNQNQLWAAMHTVAAVG